MSYDFTGTGAAKCETLASGHETIGPKSWEMWLYVKDLPSADQVLWEKSEDIDDTNVWEKIEVKADGTLSVVVCKNTGGAQVGTTLSASSWLAGTRRWFHVCVTCEHSDPNTTTKIYVNGVLKATSINSQAKATPPESHLYIGNSRQLDKPANSIRVGQTTYWGSLASAFKIYQRWCGQLWNQPTDLVSAWLFDTDMVGVPTGTLTGVGTYELKDHQPPNIEWQSRENQMNPLVDAYVWLWYLIETSGFIETSRIDPLNRIRYDVGKWDPTKDEVEDADLPEIRIAYSGGDTNVRLASDLAQMSPTYVIMVTTGDNRFDKELGDIVWRIIKSLARYPDFDFAAEGLSYIKVLSVGSATVGDRAEAEQARGVEGWYQVCTVTIEMWLSKAEMGVT